MHHHFRAHNGRGRTLRPRAPHRRKGNGQHVSARALRAIGHAKGSGAGRAVNGEASHG